MLIILGWGDAPKVEKGHRDADAAIQKVKDRAVKQAEEIEGGNEGLAETFAKITTEAALFFAALAAFNAAKDLIIKVNRSNSALGRFAANVGMAPQEVASWSIAAERMGGSAEDAQSSVDSIAKAIFSLNTEGQKIPDEISRLSALSGVNIDMRHGVSRAMADISEAAQKLSRIDPAQTHFLLRGMGIADSVGAAMIQHGRSTGDTARMLAPSDEAIRAAQDLAASFARAQEDVKSLGSAVAEQLDPVLSGLLDSLSSIIEADKQLEASEIVDWAKSIGSGLKKFAKVLKQGIDTLGQAEDFLDRTAPPSILHPRTQPLRWSEWWKSGEQLFQRHNPLAGC